MEEIAKIISAITEVTGLDRFSIIYGRSDECKKARGILCYIALKDRYGLTTALVEMLSKSRSQCTFASEICQEEMEESIGYLIMMNEVRKKLGMTAIMTDKLEELQKESKRQQAEQDEMKSKENSKNIFGIEYSKSEEQQLKQAILSAKAFMANYCEIGQKADERLTRCPY